MGILDNFSCGHLVDEKILGATIYNKTIFLAGILDNLVKNGCPIVACLTLVVSKLFAASKKEWTNHFKQQATNQSTVRHF